ncbi:hypothetical protein SADUNF_Sadunf18G0081800 [Salix dunnii]|uniref:Transmembrane protein 208 n=1 Tax=Salix dunnii TaxID=1413687 RepID=A0A835J518_9ROSI|nr:hypothetical protein SADUNF_Sadunf18G0081800 [Salix dunnii]
MANQGAKKRKEENARHMANLRRLIIVCNVIYVLVRLVVFHSSFTWKHWIGLILTSVAYFIPYRQLAAMASPTYAEDGDLLDGGFDMSTGGICGYLHDVIYITSFVQLMSIISGKFWYTYLAKREIAFFNVLFRRGNSLVNSALAFPSGNTRFLLCRGKGKVGALGIEIHMEISDYLHGEMGFMFLSRYQHLEHTNLLDSLEDFFHMVQRTVLRMKKPARRGKSWRRKLHEASLSRQEIDNEVPDRKGAYGSINNVIITGWDIYNDGHILVHGVEDFFNPQVFFDVVDGILFGIEKM